MFKFNEKIMELDREALRLTSPYFEYVEQIKSKNQERMLSAFVENRVSTAHLVGTTGYGYDDIGRDTLDRVFATVVGAEAAIVRHNFASGTHAITTALFGLLRPDDTLLYATGRPYDTLHKVIGHPNDKTGSLADFGIRYEELDLLNDEVDLIGLCERLKRGDVRVVALQKSCGYASRRTLSNNDIKAAVDVVRSISPDIFVFVDNCYGEFVECTEPTMMGVDLMAGSLIKNAGGGIASSGGYIAGTKEAVERAAYRLTVPGIGAEIGASYGVLRELYLGLYNAPAVVAEAVKTAIYSDCLFELCGMDTRPGYRSKRFDILTSVDTGDEDKLITLCREIQHHSPIDSFVTPVPAPMPGYADEVIMAAGAFTAGSSIELSCDGPLRAPYTAFLQGGLNFAASRIAVLNAVNSMV